MLDDDSPRGLEDIGFGVCDSPQQLAAKFPDFEGTVWLAVIRRSDQPDYGGWRWGWTKWGHYYGDLNYDDWPEYLYDCDGEDGRPLIDEQYLFSVSQPTQNIGGLDSYISYLFKDGQATYAGKVVQDHGIAAYLRAVIH